jgi:hypothetical protein
LGAWRTSGTSFGGKYSYLQTARSLSSIHCATEKG